MINQRKYGIDIQNYRTSFEEYYNLVKTFGAFDDEGTCYRIVDKNTPRQWFSFLCNDKFGSLVTNTGMGFQAFLRFDRPVTKYYHPVDYLIRTVNAGREAVLCTGERAIPLFAGCENLQCDMRPGYTQLYGSADGIAFHATFFVPQSDSLECWSIRLKNTTANAFEGSISFSQTWSDSMEPKSIAPVLMAKSKQTDGSGWGDTRLKEVFAFFHAQGCEGNVEYQTDTMEDGTHRSFPVCFLKRSISLKAGEEQTICVLSGAGESENAVMGMIEQYTQDQVVAAALLEVQEFWKGKIYDQHCTLPNKNMEYFLNTWLKNQLYLTVRFNRGAYMGYRDVMQDAWGYLFVEPQKVRQRIIECLSHMYSDGRCPRQYDIWGDFIDRRDFADSPVWVPITVTAYIKETGDFDVLSETIGFLDSTKTATVEEHIYLALEYLFQHRGKNGLCLWRGGDWLDSLEGMGKDGPATAAWLTMAAFYAQNLMAELYTFMGWKEKAALMRSRSADYKASVNASAWDGDWFVYGFTKDGDPVGSHKCKEGKIYLNPQTWAIFTGIVDSEDKIRRICRSVNVYLTSVYGPHLLMPPYINHGEGIGRLLQLRPGTYGNGSIYLHAASFKVFSDAARLDGNEAVDTLLRLLPNHPDNPDCRRTSEPYCTGNVHLGVSHERFGQNIFTWFTATPAWLIHGGFDEILGVKPGYDSIFIHPVVPQEWKQYCVRRTIRGTRYEFHFQRGTENKVVADGMEMQDMRVPYTDKQQVTVTVTYSSR